MRALGVRSCSLTADHDIAQGRWVNGWFASHERAGSTGSYLEDLARAHRLSESVTDGALTGHLTAAGLGTKTALADCLVLDRCIRHLLIQRNPRLKAMLEARS